MFEDISEKKISEKFIKDGFVVFDITNKKSLKFITEKIKKFSLSFIKENRLKLHKEFKTEKENKRWKYYDTWTYDFRFDRTKLLQENIEYEKEVNRLWCLVREINLSETFIIDQLSL